MTLISRLKYNLEIKKIMIYVNLMLILMSISQTDGRTNISKVKFGTPKNEKKTSKQLTISISHKIEKCYLDLEISEEDDIEKIIQFLENLKPALITWENKQKILKDLKNKLKK